MEPPADRADPPTSTTGRLRAACDSCHQAKIRCSGGSPCVACEVSELRCTYSPGNRLGRPKGSKNKRTLILEGKNKRTDAQEDNSVSDAMQWSEPGPRRQQRHQQQQQHQQQEQQQQQQSDSMSIDFDAEHGSDTAFAHTDDFISDGNPSALPGPSLVSLLDSMGGSRPNSSHDDDLNNLFAQASAALSHPQSSHAMQFDTLDTRGDSGYGTGTSNSSVDEVTMPSPHSIMFSTGKPGAQGTYTSTPWDMPRCSCLQQQVQLVYQLGDLQFSHAEAPAVDRVLQGVQLAQGPWKSLMHCKRCQSQGIQNEAYLLFATSIRILLSSVQKLNMSLYPVDASRDVSDRRDLSEASAVGVSVGSFQLTGETKAEVIGLAIRRALRNITSALLHLWERSGRPRPLSRPGFGSGSSRSSDNSAPNTSSMNILSGMSADLQRSHRSTSLSPMNTGFEDIGSLLNTLQCTMRVMKGDLNTCT